MSSPRQCSRPACAQRAVATLTFVYADSIAVIGPLSHSTEPHSWDLCARHAARITVPRGWELMRSAASFPEPVARDEDDLTALAEAVSDGAGRAVASRPAARRDPVLTPVPQPARTRPARRGHLRVLPDPE